MNEFARYRRQVRLVTPGAPEHPRSKLNSAADEIAAVYQDTEHDRGIQLVFLDLGTPKAIDTVPTRDDEAAVIVDTETPEEVALLTDVYADLKHKLTARGIPANEVRFVHEAKTREARFRLFQAANDGLARVIVGSTAKLGTGVNVQKRLAALHHLDAPWRPMDVEHFVVTSPWLTNASGGHAGSSPSRINRVSTAMTRNGRVACGAKSPRQVGGNHVVVRAEIARFC
jgi:hypothetical protein